MLFNAKINTILTRNHRLSFKMSAITNTSLYIPHVFANISQDRIIDAFEGLSIGKIKNIDLVGKMGKDGKPYNAVYIHFEYWCDSSVARNFQERVLNPNKVARIVYEDPWFWIVLENKGQKHVSGSRNSRLEIVPQEQLVTPVEQLVTPVKQLTNQDFADMFRDSYKESLKMSAELDFDDTDFKDICRKIHFDDDEANMEEIEQQLSCFDRKHDKVLEQLSHKVHFENDDAEANMDEIEKLMDEEDQHISYFDRRYVQILEQENNHYRSRDNDYFECLGRSQYQISILMNEITCLKSELSLLKDQGIINPGIYY